MIATLDTELAAVVARFQSIPRLTTVVGQAIRQAFNEVVDGARTRRYRYEQLDKEEKAYIGKKVEIILRNTLSLPKGDVCDLAIDGTEVDIKWSMSGNWMIPQENFGRLCLLLTATDTESTSVFSMGLIRANLEYLTAGSNQDKKKQISAKGMPYVHWLIKDGPLPPNFLLQLPEAIRKAILRGEGGQERINQLFRLVQRKPIPRAALEAVGNQIDTAKRVRDARLALSPEGIVILSGRYDREKAQKLGLPVPGLDEFISFKP